MPQPELNHYAILEVARNATELEIRAAYRRLARQHHPDANPGAEGERQMRRINEAWETLRDPQLRSMYDRQLPIAVRRAPVRTVRRQPPPRREATARPQDDWLAEDAPRESSSRTREFEGDASIDWYAAIGVRQGATRPEILKALSRMAASLNSSPVSATEFTRTKMSLRDAWTILGDQYVRASYDRARKAHQATAGSTSNPAANSNSNPAEVHEGEPEQPAPVSPPAGYRIGPVTVNGVAVDKGRDLRGADLRGADLRGLDLAGIDLREAKLQGVDFEAASLRKANLAAADLTGANLKHADLSNADCQGAWLRQADLSWAALHATSLFRANLTGCSLANAVGPGVNLDYADLARADFTGARITPQLIARGKLQATIMPDGSVRGS